MARVLAGFSLVSGSLAVPLTIKMGQDTDWPPYAFKNAATNALEGFGIDVARGVQAVCTDTLAFEFVETNWNNCWSSADGGTLGAKLEDGTLDACMTYTHTQGRRPEVADFSFAILDENKPAGLLTRLEGGCPVVDGMSDLKNKTVVDVAGWAPTADGLGFVENKCTKMKYSSDHTVIEGSGTNANDAALTKLLDGSADAMFVYADQAKNYQCDDSSAAATTWNCTMWKGFGTTFAYVQTGQFGHGINGTTLAMTKKGSTIPSVINPCLMKYIKTKEYYDVCKKHNFEGDCYRNEFFPAKEVVVTAPQKPTDEQAGPCSSGYCPCTEEAQCKKNLQASGSVKTLATFMPFLLAFWMRSA